MDNSLPGPHSCGPDSCSRDMVTITSRISCKVLEICTQYVKKPSLRKQEGLLCIGSQKSACIGMCLSVLLPIILCEFAYMDLVAVKGFRTKIWTTEVDDRHSLPFPSFAVFLDDITVEVNFLNCSVVTSADGQKVQDCSKSMQRSPFLDVPLNFSSTISKLELLLGQEVLILYDIRCKSEPASFFHAVD